MKLYRFEYSCYARKAQMALDLVGARYEVVDVPFGDRSELVQTTGGYVQVPVLVGDDGTVIVDSRRICEALLERPGGDRLAPAPWQAAVWAYADWCDGPLEDVVFRLASPGVRRRFARAVDRALYTFIKERKYGTGCVEEWERSASELTRRAQRMLAPTAATLARQPYIVGDAPTLADAALYGQCAMLAVAEPALPQALAASLGPWMQRLEAATAR